MRAIKIPASPAGRKTRNIIVLFFSLFFSLAVFSQISAASPKPKPGFGGGDWLYYKANNDLTAYLGKKSSSLPTARYQKGNDYLQFSMTGVSSTTSVSLETDTKKPNTPTLFYRNILDGVDANYQITNIPFRVKEEIVLKANSKSQIPNHKQVQNPNDKNSKPTTYKLTPTSFLFSAETSAKPVKQDDGSIAFFGENGEYLFQLDKPFMIDAEGERSEDVLLEIIPIQTKIASEETIFGDSNLERKSGLPSITNQYNGAKSFVNTLKNSFANIKKVLDLRGIEPLESWIASQTPHQARPRTELFYHKENFNQNRHRLSVLEPQQYTITLSADSEWLKNAAYPVIIDPTVTHNADANFTGQFNRSADSDTTSSTKLESSYPEATKDPHTVLLLHFNEANGTTAGIRDYASTARVITANGSASTTSSVTQLGLGNSAAFDGTGDYVSAPDSDDWNFGSGDFSIEAWVRTTASGENIVAQWESGSPQRSWGVSIGATGKLSSNFDSDGSGADFTLTGSVTINDGTWHHIAVIRSGNTFTLYIDSKTDGTTSSTITLFNSTAANLIGASNPSSPESLFNGHIDEVRILKGRALTPEEIKAAASRRPYAVYTSSVLDASASVQWDTLNWTEGGVNTGDGETPYSTNSLVAQWNFNETSGTTATSSTSGSCQTCAGTLNGFSYTASQDQATTTTGWTNNNKKWGGGSLMFDGVNDYVSVPDNDAWNFGTGNFTIEMWMNFSVLQNSHFFNQYADGSNYWKIYFNNDTKQLNFGALTSGSGVVDVNAPWSPNTNTWYHIALVRYGSTESVNDWNLFINGKALTLTKASGLWANSWGDYAGSINIGRWGGGGYLFNGILDSTRIYKGRALSASEILSNYNAGNIEIQTRTGATSDPNDGTWEAWKPTTGETQMFSLDSDAVNWHSDIMASTTIATSTETVIKAEGTGSLKIRTGMASTTAGTVALWHFEETGTTTGTYLYDETANNNDATTTGTTVVDGIFGKARKFNEADRLNVLNSSSLQISTLSIVGWIKRENPGTGGIIIGYGVGGWLGYILSNNTLAFGKNGTSECVSTGTVSDTNWHLIAITYDTSTCRFYIDGVSVGSPAQANPTFSFTTDLTMGSLPNGTYPFKGTIDELAVYNRVLSPDEIAETYRMGANHHLTRQVSATDLSSANKLAFNVASDRPGTYLETMLGESDYANYELASSTLALSTTTVLYIKGDEIASSTSLKDSSFSGKAITANGNARTAGGGKIGNSVYFDGTGDYLSLADSDDWAFSSGDFTIDWWVNFASLPASHQRIYSQWNAPSGGKALIILVSLVSGQYKLWGEYNFDTSMGGSNLFSLSINNWYHMAVVRDGNTIRYFFNGTEIGTASITGNIPNVSETLYIGSNNGSSEFVNGYMDETRIIKGAALTADQIRQAYEYGLRIHPITIDFGATLQTSDLISSATDYNFSLTATTSGLSATTSGLYLGDKIIIKENLGGTEYTAQGTVNAINTATGAITVPSWDTGSTFPASNGYSPNATVFKWQREYFDLTGAATTTRNAITNLTLRPTNGAEGRTIYLDDFRYNTNYLTASSSSAITSSNNRYLQYRAIFTSTDTFVSPFLSAFNTLYTALANSFPALIGISGGGFLSF